MDKEELKRRFKKFAINVAELIMDLPENRLNRPYFNQLIRSSSSAAANYRATCRAKSTADFINKLKIVEEETDESIFFLELLQHFNRTFNERILALVKESGESLSIIVSSLKTVRENYSRATQS